MIDWVGRSICILLSLGILANALLVRRLVHAWTFPAVLFALAWFFYTIVPLVCFLDVHVYPVAMLYIFGAVTAVSIGSLSGWRTAFENNAIRKRESVDYYAGNVLLVMFLIASVLTIVFLLLNSISQGISLRQLVSNLNESAAEYAGRRYAYDISSNAYQQISNILAYFVAGLGGLIVSSHRNRYVRYTVIFASLFPPLFVMMSQSARGMLFLCAAIFYAGILVAKAHRADFSLLSRRAVPALLVGIAIAVPLVTASFFARGVAGGAGQTIIDDIAPYWASYTSGHLFAFSDWFGSYTGRAAAQFYDDPGMTKGFYTFMSAFKLLGDDRPVPLGVYGEYLTIPPYIGTNIYTVFRGMIHDFGVPGSLLALVVLSYLAHQAYKVMLNATMPAMSVAVFLFTVAFIYQSFIISAFMWTTLMVGLFLVGAALYAYKLTFSVESYGTAPRLANRAG